MATNAENIIFSLEDKGEKSNLTLEELNTFIEANVIDTNVNDYGTEINVEELENYYRTTYNVKSLQQILQYYGIPKKNMVKDEMLQRLLFFEMEPENREIVLKRMRLWQNISELKSDTYFAKFINFNV
jgi:hypothetical protein